MQLQRAGQHRLQLVKKGATMRKYAILMCIGLLLFAAPAFSQQSMDNFYVTVGEPGNVLTGGGSGYNGGEWYIYPTMWINQWFYDHPFDPTRGKIIHIEFDWMSNTLGATTDITVAVNWSTPEWSYLGYGTAQPPLPGVDEQLYIRRSTMMHEYGFFPDKEHFSFDFIIWEYNPEWVSIDVMGYNFVIGNGVIIHECTVGTEESSWGAIKANYR